MDTGDQINVLVTTEIKEKILGSFMVKHTRAGRQRRIPLHWRHSGAYFNVRDFAAKKATKPNQMK